MNQILSKLKSEKDVEQSSLALQQLYSLFEQPEGGSQHCQEEIHFDFFMEDGIQTVSNAIRREGLDVAGIHQGLKLMFRVSEENACHWGSIWDSMGKLDGMIHFLETHCANESLFTSALELCRKISQFRLLGVEAKDILRWMPLWDLLLCGVESYIDRSHVFFSFCHLLESQKDELIPVEMRGRISLAITRGLETLQLRAPENQIQITTFRTSLSRFALDDDEDSSSSNTNGGNIGGETGSKSYNRCMFIPCSAAA
jgi:hypothetical protein